MRTLTSGALTVQAYDAIVWLQERNLLKVQVTQPTGTPIKRVLLWEGHYSNTVAAYVLNANSEVTIDVTDFMRMRAHGHELGERMSDLGVKLDDNTHVTAGWTIGGLINYKRVFKPASDIVQAFIDSASGRHSTPSEHDFIIPPTAIYEAIALVPPAFPVVEYRSGSDALITWLKNEGELYAGDYSIDLGYGAGNLVATYEDLWTGELVTPYASAMRQLVCGRKYAAVRWISFTGVTRVATMEARTPVNTTDETIKLLTQDNSYNQVKGRVDSLTLFMDALDAYDYWYYSDIVTSSRVEVSLDGFNWFQVEVTTKAAKVPTTSESGKLNDLEISVNFAKYDAFTM